MKGDIIKELRINQRIRASEVRLIGEAGEQLGVMPLRQALEAAREKNLDLVEVASTSVPPVCRLLDYGKYKYLQTKKEREARKAQKTNLLREIRVRPKTDDHDLEDKVRLVKKLLAEGDKVKVSVIFRGREITHPEIGWKKLKKMMAGLEDSASVERPPAMEGRNMIVIFAPAKSSKDSTGSKGSPDAEA